MQLVQVFRIKHFVLFVLHVVQLGDFRLVAELIHYEVVGVDHVRPLEAARA